MPQLGPNSSHFGSLLPTPMSQIPSNMAPVNQNINMAPVNNVHLPNMATNLTSTTPNLDLNAAFSQILQTPPPGRYQRNSFRGNEAVIMRIIYSSNFHLICLKNAVNILESS